MLSLIAMEALQEMLKKEGLETGTNYEIHYFHEHWLKSVPSLLWRSDESCFGCLLYLVSRATALALFRNEY
ncbi:unnamed protein product [Brassica rapa subsp. narinosa]